MRPALFVAAEVAGIRDLIADLVDAPTWRDRSIADQVEALATRYDTAHGVGDERVVPVAACWHPDLICASRAAILDARLGVEGWALAVARELGFADAAAARAAGAHDPRFEAAVDAVVEGDLAGLRALLDTDPGLALARSRYGHGATLLHYVGANGVETWRQVVPGNAVRMVDLLLERGAEVDAVARMYGGSTTLALVSTSAHPRAAGLRGALERRLVAAGAQGRAIPVDSEVCLPILTCSDLLATIAVLTEALAFTVDFRWGEPPTFAGLSWDRSRVFLCQGAQGQSGSWCFLEVEDVDRVHAGLKDHPRLRVLEGPVDRPWGTRELLVEIPDAHVIRIAGPRRG